MYGCLQRKGVGNLKPFGRIMKKKKIILQKGEKYMVQWPYDKTASCLIYLRTERGFYVFEDMDVNITVARPNTLLNIEKVKHD